MVYPNTVIQTKPSDIHLNLRAKVQQVDAEIFIKTKMLDE